MIFFKKKSLQVLEHKQLHSTVFGVQYWRVQSRHACEKKRDYDLPSCTTVVYTMTFAPPFRESPSVKTLLYTFKGPLAAFHGPDSATSRATLYCRPARALGYVHLGTLAPCQTDWPFSYNRRVC
jgi:hypothetical protein